MIQRFFEYLFLKTFKQLSEGYLTVRTPQAEYHFGDSNSTLQGQVVIHHWHAYVMGIFSGEVGLGEAYMKGYWSSSDPIELVRLVVRNRQHADPDKGWFSWVGKKINRIRHLLKSNQPKQSKKNIAFHYDLGNAFYKLWLDPTLAYSAAYFSDGTQTLEEAQIKKYQIIIEKLNILSSDHILEIGSGWGGFAVYAAQTTGCKITTTTISRQQYDYVEELIKKEHLEHLVTLLFSDYRNLDGEFDKIVSIEMFEAVGLEHYDDYFSCIYRRLRRGGAALIQTITMNEAQWDSYLSGTDWIQRFIFPGALLASVSEIFKAVGRTGLLVPTHVEDIGLHYVLTLKSWRNQFFQNLESVRKLGYSEEFIRMWDWYLSYCAGAFAERYIGDIQLVLSHPEAPATMKEPRVL